MKPTLGRTVHYRGRTDWHSAMVIREEPLVLRVFVDAMGTADASADYNATAVEGNGPGCWRWPPRVEATPDPRVGQSTYDTGIEHGFERAREEAARIADDQARRAAEHQERGRHMGDDEVHGQAKAQAMTIARLIRELKP